MYNDMYIPQFNSTISNLHYVFQKMENSKQQRQSKSEGDSDEETVKLKSEIETLKALKSKLKGTIIVASERKYLSCSLEIFSNFLP